MHRGNPLRRGAGTCSIAALTALCALLPPSALAASGQGDLSPRLAELARPAVRSASPRAQAKALGLAVEGPGSLLRDGNRVVAQVRFDHGAAAGVKGLRRAGAKVVGVDTGYQAVTVAAKPAELRALGGVAGVAGVRPLLRPFTAESTCPSGAVVSEGVRQLRAGEGEYEPESEVTKDEARKAFGVDGSGVTVGILSDSFNRATEAAEGGEIATHQEEDVASGDLPGTGNTCLDPIQETPVDVLPGKDSDAEGADEGRAMAQIVHDVAPGANLAFATAFTPEVFEFAENIEKLAEPTGSGGAEAGVIADDVSFYEEPFFQEGPVGNAIRKVTEDGVTYLTAAGNDNSFDSSGNEIGSWEAEAFRDSGSCPPSIVAFSQQLESAGGSSLHPTHCMDFDPGAQVDKTFGIKVAPGKTLTIDLQWAEPWNGVLTDLDAFLLNSTGGLIAASAEDNVHATQIPFEFIQWENESSATQTVQLVLNRFSGGLPRLKFGLLENGSEAVVGTEYPRSTGTDVVGPAIYGHAGSADAITVGATPFNNSATVERYSSRGPVTYYFKPVEGIEAAEELPEPEVTAKPDVTATDCGVTTFFSFKAGVNWRFCGTSAAAPHAAGVAALMLDDTETALPAEVRSGLLAGARLLDGISGCAQGDGLLDAVAAIEALHAPLPPPTPECPPPGPVASVEEARAPGDWGSETPPATPPGTPPAPSPPAVTPPSPTPAAGPPQTSIRRAPRRTIFTRRRTAKVLFRFGADQAGVIFLCKVDAGRFHRCPAKFARFYRLGRHVLRVKAQNAEGRTDATPAVYRFRVGRLLGRHSRR